MLTTRSATAREQLDRIVAGDDGVGGVVLHAEMVAVGDRREQLEEHVLLLGELGILPEAVLVVVLQAEDDVVLAGDRQHAVDALDDPFQALSAVDLGIALAGEDAADGPRAAQPAGDADHLGLAVDGPLAAVGVGVGEVGRAAEHRHGEAGRARSPRRRGRGRRLEAGEEAVVHLQAVGVERPGHLDPVEDRHGALAGDLVEVALREGGESSSDMPWPPGLPIAAHFFFADQTASSSSEARSRRPLSERTSSVALRASL